MLKPPKHTAISSKELALSSYELYMMKTKIIIILLTILFSSKESFTQNSPEDIGSKFFELYKKQGSDKALDYLFATNKYANDSKDAIDNLKINLKKTSRAMGLFQGYELLTKKNAGQNITMMTFIAKHDREPLIFRMLFYKPSGNWQVQNFKFDNTIDQDLEEASKIYRP